MAKFMITIRRHVSKLDEFTQEIEAADHAEAETKASEIANEADSSCPDDCEEIDDFLQLGDFYVEEVSEVQP